MTVTLSWINMLEGYMWKRIRGAGLAYGAGVYADMRKGQLSFYVYRSPNGFAAWNEARKIVTEISSGDVCRVVLCIDHRLRLTRQSWKARNQAMCIL